MEKVELMDLNADLAGIARLMRLHIEIRNRSWMKRVHRDCFLGSDAVSFLITHGFSDTRADAVEFGQNMINKNFFKHASDPKRRFCDAYIYYRFADDEPEACILAPSNGGNGRGVYYGQGGCKFSFAPHTAHNSYVLDIALAEEVERAVAGASIESRAHAFAKLRARIREEAANDASDWILTQHTEVNQVPLNVYERARPKGDFKNVRMTGLVPQNPKCFVEGLLDLSHRGQWDSMFSDGVVVEAVELGEPPCIFVSESAAAGGPASPPSDADSHVKIMLQQTDNSGSKSPAAMRATDNVNSFLNTVDVAGVPPGMSIAFLNDSERQFALAHLRKQMMAAHPMECMRCDTPFQSQADIRFCPCCAVVSCVSCVSRRVFEVVSRQVVNICVHCWRESSRVRHPPEALKGKAGGEGALAGKWWRLEDLGLGLDQSTSKSVASTGSVSSIVSSVTDDAGRISIGEKLQVGAAEMTPLLAGLMDDLEMTPIDTEEVNDVYGYDSPRGDRDGGDDLLSGGYVKEEVDENWDAPVRQSLSRMLVLRQVVEAPETSESLSGSDNNRPTIASLRMARCKTCGELIPRDMDAIDAHTQECLQAADSMKESDESGGGGGGGGLIGALLRSASMGFGSNRSITSTSSNSPRRLGGVVRRAELDKKETRILYRTSRSVGTKYKPRDVCALQDAFCDPDGTFYCYEISVRHCDVRGSRGHVTSDVMLQLHTARPVKGNKGVAALTIVSQVDTRAKGAQWWWPFMPFFKSGGDLVAAKKMDMVRELKAAGPLQNILTRDGEAGVDPNAPAVTLEDFDLLAVLGRGGFGKVMQVRHRPTNAVYAMKILKKSELRRRKQVERTNTECKILAAVRHPYIVCLHYAFQSPTKLYMVMDFIQGGDFFTLMRKFRKLPEDWVRLYVAEIGLALQHLHDMEVVYRDLKPENILLSGEGHVKLTDFGLSRHFEMRPAAAEDIVGEDNVLTRSFCGTEQYMSPEMLLQQGHNKRMDWWCLGLLMHEMITARHPFHGATHYDTLRNMVSAPPRLDPRLSADALFIVKGLLTKNPQARLGGKNGIHELKVTPFFTTLDWPKVESGTIEMPYKPELTNSLDLSSFETVFTREDAVDSVVVEGDDEPGSGGSSKVGLMGMLRGSKGRSLGGGNNDDGFENFGFVKGEVKGVNSAANSPRAH